MREQASESIRQDLVEQRRERKEEELLMIDDFVERPPGYALERIIGRGSFSECWLARHELSGSRAVIKKVPRDRTDGQLLDREVHLWFPLDHPNILQLFEVISLHDYIYLTMEWAEGGELFRLLARHPKGLPSNQASRLFAQICQGTHYLHKRGIAHRDLKLENIMLDSSESIVKIGDFGFACAWTDKDSCTEWLGSPEYAAPELLVNEPYDPVKADCWSLGVILYALFTGYLPFSGVEDDCRGIIDVERKIRHRIINGMYTIPEGFPQEYVEILRGLFEYDATKRWSTQRLLDHAKIRESLQVVSSDAKYGGGDRVLLERLTVAELKGIKQLRVEDERPGPVVALKRILLRAPPNEYPQIHLSPSTGVDSSLTSPELNSILQVSNGGVGGRDPPTSHVI